MPLRTTVGRPEPGRPAASRLTPGADSTEVGEVLLVVLLVGVAFAAGFIAVRGARGKKTDLAPRPIKIAARRPFLVALVIGLALGIYDGFFGPGTGAFLIALYAAVFGDDLNRATANAKVANFGSK